jgi:hypothetical protein
MSAPRARLPRVVLSSVVRSTHQGESHGGVYLVDLETEEVEQVMDWNDPSISWEGRGADRGLRGIAFAGDHVYLAASDEIFVFDPAFRRLGSFSNAYLKHCHEIDVADGKLFLTSTGYDSVLVYDLAHERFDVGYRLRFGGLWRGRRRLGIRPRPSFGTFDPQGPGGPAPGDTSHVNSVIAHDGAIFVGGTGLGTLWRIRGEGLDRFARIPYGSHNARPFRDGVLLNHTATDRIAYLDRRGSVRRSLPLPTYDPSELENADLGPDLARQAFGRGLTVVGDDLVVGGSSPATVTVYRLDPPEIMRSVRISKDLRNAIHGLEVWPFDG